jgi:hypothetical protein
MATKVESDHYYGVANEFRGEISRRNIKEEGFRS